MTEASSPALSNRFEENYLGLLVSTLAHGTKRPPAREGIPGTRGVFGAWLGVNMLDGFPILTTRKVYVHGVAAELAAFLKGATKVSQFEELGCPYWSADAERWKPGQNKVGRIYGVQWRHWRTWDPVTMANRYTDQIDELIKSLHQNPFGRRHLLTAWNPGELDQMCLPPCHVLAQFYVETVDPEDVPHLSMTVYMRSVDLCLGLPSDFVLYGLLHALIAREVGMQASRAVWFLGDAHIYDNHIKQVEEQLSRKPREQARLLLAPETGVNQFKPEHVSLVGYDPAAPIKYPLNSGVQADAKE